jgi:hypothetical protein
MDEEPRMQVQAMVAFLLMGGSHDAHDAGLRDGKFTELMLMETLQSAGRKHR